MYECDLHKIKVRSELNRAVVASFALLYPDASASKLIQGI
jgi:hypothetical protein